VRFLVPFYSNGARFDWGVLSFKGDQAIVAENSASRANQRLGRLACFASGRWQLIRAARRAEGLVVDEPVDVGLIRAAEACVAERGGRLVLVSGSLSPRKITFIGVVAGALVLPLLSLAVSLVLLSRFRRDVLRNLRAGETCAASLPPADVPASAGDPIPGTLVLRVAPPTDEFRRAGQRLRRQLIGYAFAALASTVPLVQAHLVFAHPSWRMWPVMFVGFAWPLCAVLAAFMKRRGRIRWIVGGYVAAAALACMASGGVRDALEFLMFHILESILLLPILVSRARAAAPWVWLILLIIVSAGLGMNYLLYGDMAQRVVPIVAWLSGLRSAPVATVLSLALTICLAALVFWRVSPRLAQLYGVLRLNDRLLTFGSFWLAYCVLIGGDLMNLLEHSDSLPAASALVVTSWAVVLTVALIGAQWTATARAARQATPGRVLYLRSFKDSRHVKLFDGIQDLLLNVATVDLIAGPDLATTLARPQELLEFLGRAAGRKYLHDLDDFERRRSAMDQRLDLEGRHRVNEYYCGNGLWIDVFRRLAADAGAVLIDIRGLLSAEAGVAYELTELIRRVPLGRIIVVTDQQRPPGLLGSLVRSAWQALPADSPNARILNPVLSIFEPDEKAPSEAVRLFGHVCHALQPRAEKRAS
jgi:hypothetical protein